MYYLKQKDSDVVVCVHWISSVQIALVYDKELNDNQQGLPAVHHPIFMLKDTTLLQEIMKRGENDIMDVVLLSTQMQKDIKGHKLTIAKLSEVLCESLSTDDNYADEE